MTGSEDSVGATRHCPDCGAFASLFNSNDGMASIECTSCGEVTYVG